MIRRKSGITIKELIEFLQTLDYNKGNEDEDGEVWIGTSRGVSEVCIEACRLNYNDVCLETRLSDKDKGEQWLKRLMFLKWSHLQNS